MNNFSGLAGTSIFKLHTLPVNIRLFYFIVQYIIYAYDISIYHLLKTILLAPQWENLKTRPRNGIGELERLPSILPMQLKKLLVTSSKNYILNSYFLQVYLIIFIYNISNNTTRFLFTTSVLNLAELIALRPDLGKLKKVIIKK